MRDSGLPALKDRLVALVGNPNSGKTTVFNALTGLRQKIGNYPGVTVERKEGKLNLGTREGTVRVLDLPGAYSLSATSADERIVSEILFGASRAISRPDLVVCVVDATNLERNLYLVSQIIDQEIPVIVGLNMMDLAEREGITIDVRRLGHELGVPVVPLVANRGKGIDELTRLLAAEAPPPAQTRRWPLPEPVQREWEELAGMLQVYHGMEAPLAFHEAMDLLTARTPEEAGPRQYAPEVLAHLKKDHEKLDFLGFSRQRMAFDARVAWIQGVAAHTTRREEKIGQSVSDRLDRIITHRFYGFVIFFALMALIFIAVFSWAEVPMQWIANGFAFAEEGILHRMAPGDLRDLLVDGALGGVSAVVMFLPQILFLFLFLGLLEDTGYMARAAFIMDRFMSRVGLHGKSFIPLLGSFACAIPGIMATRTIEDSRSRLATMLVAPLMSCSARLPVYALLIAATIPAVTVLGVSLPGLVFLAMYFLGLLAALGVAWIFKKTLLRGAPPAFIMELPPYRLPSIRSIALQLWERASVFLRKAGTIILGASIILWFFATYPKMNHGTASERLQHSFAGQAGRLIEPLIRPLGFDWKIGIGLMTSLLQREMFVSTMGTIYNVEDHDAAGKISLTQHMRHDTDPSTGKSLFTPLTGICLMIYYVLAMQCLSTVAIMHRETNGWKWPLFQVAYMTALAYTVTFVVYRLGLWLGLGG
jgi:ferrous iron transport protein B